MAEFAVEGRGLRLDIEARDEIYEKDAYNSANNVRLLSVILTPFYSLPYVSHNLGKTYSRVDFDNLFPQTYAY